METGPVTNLGFSSRWEMTSCMLFFTQQETYEWLRKTSISVRPDTNGLSFPSAPAFCFRLELPTKIYRVSNVVNYLLPYEQGSLSCQSLLWFTDWGMWNEIHERAGMLIWHLRVANILYLTATTNPCMSFLQRNEHTNGCFRSFERGTL